MSLLGFLSIPLITNLWKLKIYDENKADGMKFVPLITCLFNSLANSNSLFDILKSLCIFSEIETITLKYEEFLWKNENMKNMKNNYDFYTNLIKSRILRLTIF